EHLARQAASTNSKRMIEPYPFPFAGGELDFRPLLSAMIQDRVSGRDLSEVARAFQRGVAAGLADALQILCARHETNIVALSGGVFQNELLLADFQELIRETGLRVWTNHQVPSNDGGISLGQAAMAVFGQQAHVGSSHA